MRKCNYSLREPEHSQVANLLLGADVYYCVHEQWGFYLIQDCIESMHAHKQLGKYCMCFFVCLFFEGGAMNPLLLNSTECKHLIIQDIQKT